MSPIAIDLSDQTAVVTGGGSGIGAAIAVTLADAGASVAVADLDGTAAQATVTAITDAGGTAAAFDADVTNRAAVESLRRDVESAYGPASILVNNAGWGQPEPFLENSPEFWEKVVAINLMGPVIVSRTFLDPMIERSAGRIVNVSSDAGRVGSTGETVYAGAKGGVIAFTKSLAREMARHGLNVNCICPGPTATPFFEKQPPKMQDALVRAIPFRRLAEPAEIAAAVAFFASDHASFITGQVLSVSGGLTMAG
jgi:2-hydroxycyclohexanecarboxyl-CoA dehydrogenase